jgi:AraC-like DNA-binding protein/ABC-type glycerol-3-phosphate transport system permease component
MFSTKSRVFTKYFGSFVSLTLVLLLIFLTVNIYLIINNVQKTLRESYQATLQQVSAHATTNINEMKRLAEIIANDSNFTSYNFMNNRNTPGNVVREFAKVKQAFSMLKSVGLVYWHSPYSEINETIYASNGRFSLNEYSRLVCGNNIGPESIREMINTLTDPVYLPLGAHTLLYMLPLPVDFISSPGVLLFVLEDKSLIPEYLPEKTGAAIIDDRCTLLAWRGLADPPSHDLFHMPDNRERIKLQTELVNQNLILYLFIDRDSFNRPLMNAVAISIGLQLFVLTVGVFLSYYFARRNYRPIQLLLSQFKQGTAASGGDRINELEALGLTLTRLREERDRLKIETTEETQLGRNRLILASLQQSKPVINSACARKLWASFTRDGCAYCVVIILIDDYLRVADSTSSKELMLIRTTICQTLEADKQNIDQAFAMDADRIDAVLAVMRGKKGEQAELSAYLACQELRRTVQKQFGLTFTCALGCSVESVEDLSRSYEIACTSAQFRFFVGRDTIITSELVKPFEIRNQYLSQESDQAIDSLVQIIRAGKTEDVQPAVDKIFSDVMSLMQIEVFNNIFFIITSRINQLVDELPDEQGEAMRSRLDLLYERKFETADEAIRTLTYSCVELSKNLACHAAQTADKGLYRQILAYLETEYKNPNLTLTAIAGHFSMHPSYLTRYFRSCSGIPLMQFLDRYRFSKSKELLIQTHMSVREILEQVGYVDEANFIRKFKKSEGISTSHYRKIYSQSE